MRPIALVLTLVLSLLAAPTAWAQPASPPYRVGVLVPLPAAAANDLVQALRFELRELGYVEGRNLVLDFKFAETPALMAERAAELVRANVDVIVASTSMPALAAKRATTTIPIVMVASADPVAVGLVASLARPGANITGSAVLTPELSTKQLELLKEISPRLSRIPVILNSTNAVSPKIWRDLQQTAHGLSLTLDYVDVREASGIDAALAAVARQRADALLVMPEPVLFPQFHRIAEFALKNHLPSISLLREFAVAGGLASYGPSYRVLLTRAASFIDKILRGAKPGDLPVEQPTKFELVINVKTAKALNLTIPRTVLVRTDAVID
ncbi:MAG TPA: ABC transporter substrate-binding protein [Methylomirabilota bacterium]|nr:ABC transporter substrate-binding protein [Methylomirabilota bacterium]